MMGTELYRRSRADEPGPVKDEYQRGKAEITGLKVTYRKLVNNRNKSGENTKHKWPNTGFTAEIETCGMEERE